MKAMKFVGLATLAVMTLGFATQASATEVGGKETDVLVNVIESDSFNLKSVPSAYTFSTPVKDGNSEYPNLPATITGQSMGVFRGYSGTKGNVVKATISDLEISGKSVIEVTALTIAGVDLMGTNNDNVLFADSAFGDTTATGNLTKEITSATIGFTADLSVGDSLTGTVMYTVDNTSTTS